MHKRFIAFMAIALLAIGACRSGPAEGPSGASPGASPTVAAIKTGPGVEGLTIKLAELTDDPWILGASTGPCADVIRAACTSAGFSPDIRHIVNDWSAVFTLVAAEAGVALAPRLAAGAEGGGFVVRPLTGSPASRNIYAAMRAGSERSPALVALLGALEKAGRDAPKSRVRNGMRLKNALAE